ncbi:hypothetical protein MKJ04_11525 [Pontibacter sp. E15-1]|uniref:hypothetical protein n=1 Tax=Pontibacter sp. E15-1 TaxID=2919918 RepID=UPI001F4FA0DE|nr:hypothetical protein [Pontibacter sp. E15-1]MCJ8165474.1 hypothetical protein [Pontibacter sp. E15-1]
MKFNAFQRMLQTSAYRAKQLGAISDEEYHVYEANAYNYNEEEHAVLEQDLDIKWRAALEAWQQDINSASAAREAKFQEELRQVQLRSTYRKNRRISCPPALQFQLWELSRAARALKVISNSDMRFIRKEMREADIAWLQELYRRVKTGLGESSECLSQ